MKIEMRRHQTLFTAFGFVVAGILYGTPAHAVGSPASGQLTKLNTNNVVSSLPLRAILGWQAGNANHILLAGREPASPPQKPTTPPPPPPTK